MSKDSALSCACVCMCVCMYTHVCFSFAQNSPRSADWPMRPRDVPVPPLAVEEYLCRVGICALVLGIELRLKGL